MSSRRSGELRLRAAVFSGTERGIRMSSRRSEELGLGLGDAGPGGDVDGLFGSILSVVKAVAAPAATFVGGAVGTVIAPGLGTAAGAYLGGKLGGAIRDSGGGGGGGGAPAPSGPAPYTNKTGD